MAEGGNEIKTGDSHMEVNECLASWLTYLQVIQKISSC